MKPNNFRKPRTGDRLLCVEFRNGLRPCELPVAKTYTASQLRWTDLGTDFDVVAVGYAS